MRHMHCCEARSNSSNWHAFASPAKTILARSLLENERRQYCNRCLCSLVARKPAIITLCQYDISIYCVKGSKNYVKYLMGWGLQTADVLPAIVPTKTVISTIKGCGRVGPHMYPFI